MSKSGKVPKLIPWIGWTLLVVGFGGFVIARVIQSDYESRAVLTQRVQVDKAGAALFGDGNTPIGSPQQMIIDDPKAVIKGTGAASDPRQVDDGYLQAHNIYPLQLKTVRYMSGLAMEGLVGCQCLGLLLVLLVRAKQRKEYRQENAAN